VYGRCPHLPMYIIVIPGNDFRIVGGRRPEAVPQVGFIGVETQVKEAAN
jgi:hypothetical protein